MFERLRSAKRLWNADKAAKQIVSLLTSSLYFARDTNGRFNPKMQNDEFVLAYVYGVIMACIEPLGVTNQEEAGYAVRLVFDHLFPDNGRRLTEVCNLRATQKEKSFMKNTYAGYAEMTQVFSSGGQNIPKVLLEHIIANYHGG